MSKKKSNPDQTQTSTMTDATRIMDVNGDEISKSNSKIVPLLHIVTGPEQGNLINLSEFQTYNIGRSQDSDMVVADTSCSRRHARISIISGGKVSIEDLGSTNGTKINDIKLSKAHELEDGDQILVGDNTRLKFALSLEHDAKIQMDVYHRATRDSLTNAFNRRRFEETLDREIAFISRGQSKGLGLILFDVDHFKKVNDSYGHPTGDYVLKKIGSRVPELIRKEDLFARIGGEEFIVLTRNESLEGLQILAERIRKDFEALKIEHDGNKFQFTVSIGLSFLNPAQKQLSREEFVKLADEALYEAKETGRNRVCLKNPVGEIKKAQ